jgi:Multicopper oxidase
MAPALCSLQAAEVHTTDMVAESPGTWMVHCHIEGHLALGMYGHYTVEPSPKTPLTTSRPRWLTRAARLGTGLRLGSYEVVGPLGAGGTAKGREYTSAPSSTASLESRDMGLRPDPLRASG